MAHKVNGKVKKEIRVQITNAFSKRTDLAVQVWNDTLTGVNKTELKYRAARDLIEQLIGRPKMRTEIMGGDGQPFVLKIVRATPEKTEKKEEITA